MTAPERPEARAPRCSVVFRGHQCSEPANHDDGHIFPISATRAPLPAVGEPSQEAGELSRLALYDAVVGYSLAWRATTTPQRVFKTDADRENFYRLLDLLRQAIQLAGKHIVDESIVRQLAAIYARRPDPPEGT